MVVVTDAGLTSEAKVTYAHEYTHALQDAAFGIDSMDLDADDDDDGAFARLGLVEGDATTAMVLWAIENLTAEDMLGISQTPLPDTTGVPAWMVSQLEFPYVAGTEFTASCTPTAASPAVDEAWADPPRSTEQVLHFAAYTEDERPIDVVEVDPDIRALGVDIVGETTLGEAMTAIWLGAFGVDPSDATPRRRDGAATGSRPSSPPRGRWPSSSARRGTRRPTPTSSPRRMRRRSSAWPVFGRLERVNETEIEIVQASTEVLLGTLADA